MSAILEQPHPPRVKKWTKEEYLDLVERGGFRDQRVYLFRGDIMEKAPHGHPHAYGIMKLSRYLTDAFAPPYEVRIQLPLLTPGESVPDPDAAVCTSDDALRKPHPSHAELIVEVSYSSLEADRALAAEYAAAGVPEYWILDTDNRRFEVRRRPVNDDHSFSGFSYAELIVLSETDTIATLARPGATVPISTFLA